MKYSPPIFRPARGATLMLVLMFAIVGGMALTSWMYLVGARLQQAERQVNQVTRNIVWNNTFAINQQYALQYSFQDVITRSASTATLNSAAWGGSDEDPYVSLQAFRSGYTYSNPAPYAYPFNNIRDVLTTDGSVYYTRTTGDTDSSQTEHLTFYNYQKSYPTPLLGDLLIIHTKPSGAAATNICKNLVVNGRVVILDSTATTANIKAAEVINQTKTGTNTTLNTSGATMLPTNYNATPRFTAGYGGASTPSAVLDGSLNMISNPTFTPGSLVDIMTNNGGYTNVSAGSASGSSSSAVQVDLNFSTPTYPPPTISPYNYSYTNPFNVVTVRLKPPSGATLGHLRINGSVDQLVLQGQTTSTDWNTADTLPPVIIWMEQEVRDIRFVGENNRRLILAVGTGSGLTCYMGWSGTSILGGSNPLRWRLHFINQYRNVYLAPPSTLNVTITGSIRTNWHINCTDSTTTTRFTLNRETSPGNLPLLLPRDAWFEPYTLVR